ncbi:hypothetical protein OC842_002463 [Tilletia horrida]|uniref:Extracellular membrane protein CFEM domain-containing protein n=1 Tax=Tilletia horrida TaxID=155126 RepID=A0AAN6GEJ7_9BASI|nr:hypothetical protein OC842_002463 [Tilletia horrida]
MQLAFTTSMARLLASLAASCWLCLLVGFLILADSSSAQSAQLCARFRNACEQICERDYKTTPSSFECKIHQPTCVCKGGRSIAGYAAMRGFQKAVNDLQTRPGKTITVTQTQTKTVKPTCTRKTATVISTKKCSSARPATKTVTLPAVTVPGKPSTITIPASTITQPPLTETVTDTQFETLYETYYDYYTETYTETYTEYYYYVETETYYDYYYLTETEYYTDTLTETETVALTTITDYSTVTDTETETQTKTRTKTVTKTVTAATTATA